MRTTFSGLLVLALGLGAIWLLWLGFGQALSAQATKSWPSKTGTVVSAGFETSGSGQNYSRTAFVQYRYSVDGVTFTNDRIAFGPKPNFKVDGTRSSARLDVIKVLATQSGGSDVTVYFDPDDPAESVLVSGGGLFFLIYLFCSALLLGMAVMIFLLMTGRVTSPVYRR